MFTVSPGAQSTPVVDRWAGRRNDLVVQRISQLLNGPHPETGSVLQGAGGHRSGPAARSEPRHQLRPRAALSHPRRPSVHVLQLLADTYGVDLDFFASQRSPEDVRADITRQALLEDQRARALLLGTTDLTASDAEELVAVIDDVLREAVDRQVCSLSLRRH